MGELERFVEAASQVEWKWSVGAFSNLTARLGWREVDGAKGRKSYSRGNGFLIDVYLSDGEVLLVEHTIESVSRPHLLSELDFELKVDEFFEKFEHTVGQIASVLGQPVFSDGAGKFGFPADQDAEWLALWPINGARLMVQERHEDRELPLRLCVVIAPERC